MDYVIDPPFEAMRPRIQFVQGGVLKEPGIDITPLHCADRIYMRPDGSKVTIPGPSRPAPANIKVRRC